MKTLLLFSPHPNQRGLAHKLAAVTPIDALVLVAATPPPKGTTATRLARLAQRAANLAVGYPLRRAWFGMLNYFEKLHPNFPVEPVMTVSNVNDVRVADLVERVKPDLVLVSGTNLLRRPLIEKIAESGCIMNLHTGISPYIKGGPNCTSWCLSVGRFDLIGNTVMWLDAGIDSGNLIATERTPLEGSESLLGLQIKVMEHAHDLYVRAVAAFKRGDELPSVPQAEIGPGRLFLTKHWTPYRIARAVLTYRRRYRQEAGGPPQEPLVLVSMSDPPPQRVSPDHRASGLDAAHHG